MTQIPKSESKKFSILCTFKQSLWYSEVEIIKKQNSLASLSFLDFPKIYPKASQWISFLKS